MKPTKPEFRRRIKSGEVLLATMLSLFRNPRWGEILAELDFDFIAIDTEHTPYSWSEVADLVTALTGHGLPSIVRIPRPSWHYVTKVFDAGAYGVLAPYCETVDEAKEVVRAARWRPLKGKFVERVMDEATFPSEATKTHLQEYNAGHVVIIGIESVPAVENLENILDVGDIDAVFVGPADLSTSMGIPRQYDRPEFDKMVRHIIEVCHKRHVPVAANFAPLEQSVKWAGEGISLVIHSVDFRVLREAYHRELVEILVAAGRETEQVSREIEREI